jgi:outer membrane lipoprotein-sorting protein
MGQKMATKQKPEVAATGDPKELFKKMHSDNTVKMLPDEKVDGVSTVVFEVVPKDVAGSPVAKSIMYFAKDTGINVKVVGKDKDGKDVFSNMSTDIKLNTEIANDHFVFKAPEGVQVMDMTGSGTP